MTFVEKLRFKYYCRKGNDTILHFLILFLYTLYTFTPPKFETFCFFNRFIFFFMESSTSMAIRMLYTNVTSHAGMNKASISLTQAGNKINTCLSLVITSRTNVFLFADVWSRGQNVKNVAALNINFLPQCRYVSRLNTVSLRILHRNETSRRLSQGLPSCNMKGDGDTLANSVTSLNLNGLVGEGYVQNAVEGSQAFYTSIKNSVKIGDRNLDITRRLKNGTKARTSDSNGLYSAEKIHLSN